MFLFLLLLFYIHHFLRLFYVDIQIFVVFYLLLSFCCTSLIQTYTPHNEFISITFEKQQTITNYRDTIIIIIDGNLIFSN